jgi:hypothetical protein
MLDYPQHFFIFAAGLREKKMGVPAGVATESHRKILFSNNRLWQQCGCHPRTGFGVGCHDDVPMTEREVVPDRGIEVMVVKVARLLWPKYIGTHLVSLRMVGKPTLARRRIAY